MDDTKPINEVTPPVIIKELSDRELQERMCELLTKQERHQKFFSNVVSVYVILNIIVAAYFIWRYLS